MEFPNKVNYVYGAKIPTSVEYVADLISFGRHMQVEVGRISGQREALAEALGQELEKVSRLEECLKVAEEELNWIRSQGRIRGGGLSSQDAGEALDKIKELRDGR